MATTQDKKAAADGPNEQTFWTRYSPHHECLLSWVGSATGHGLVIGVMFLSGLAISWGRSDSARPPNMDVVQLPPGDGFPDGESGTPSPFGQANAAEAITPQVKETKSAAVLLQDKFQDIKGPQLDVPDAATLAPGESEDPFKDLAKGFEQIGKEPPKQLAKANVAGNVGDPKGVKGSTGLGGVGGGVGPGRGKGKGPGIGSGLPARSATRQEILARKWRFDMSGDGKEHADKLSAVGVILAIPDPSGKPLFIRDLKRRPVEVRPGDIGKFKDAVHWINNKPDSVFILARELQLPFVPKFVAMYLPREREEKMAEAERRFAQRLSRPLERVNATWFDFQLRNGVYEPVVLRQE